jgi:metallo-beta-lactamase family protein
MYYLQYVGPDSAIFRFCIDAGMFQIGSGLGLFKTNSKLLFKPNELDCVILTHAHLDHCGRLPYLVKEGFGGKIYSTPATKKIAEVVMHDAARIQTDDPDLPQFYFHQRGLSKKELSQESEGNEETIVLPPKENIGLYSEVDVDLTMFRFQTHEYHKKFKVHPNLEIEFFDAGHILGSAYVVITEISSGQKIVFSGDLGNVNKPIIEDPEILPAIQNVTHIFIETTYGNRLHGDLNPKEKLRKICYKTLKSKGQVIIPSFSVERAQEIIYFLVELMRANELPQVPIFLDSPMASKVLQIVLDHPELYDKEMRKNLSEKTHPLKHSQLKILDTPQSSKSLNAYDKPCIIIAGSGMLTGGRIMKHLKFHLENEKNTLLFVGYQAEGTLGRKILNGEKIVEVEGRQYEVKVNIELINEFSAHADQKILRDWVSGILVNKNPTIPTVFLMHGERDASLTFGQELGKIFPNRVNTYWPHFGEVIELWK